MRCSLLVTTLLCPTLPSRPRFRWYFPEEVSGGRKPDHGAKEVFESSHVDENTLDTILHRITVLHQRSYKEDDASDTTFYVSRFYDHVSNMYRPTNLGNAGGVKKAIYSKRAPASFTSFQPGQNTNSGTDGASAGAGVGAGAGAGTGAGAGSSTAAAAGAGASTTTNASPRKKKPAKKKKRKLRPTRDSFYQACSQLQLSAVPPSLPCRQGERNKVFEFLRAAIRRGGLGCALYISGMPGTGKTATVHQVLRELDELRLDGQLPPFQSVEINALKLASPHQAYSILWHALTGRHTSPARAAQLLERRFSTTSSRRACTVLVVDELDYLVTRKQTVLYNLFEWPTRKNARLIVVGIANTMDLPERLLPKIHSRLGMGRIVFAPYRQEQIQAIIKSRLEGLDAFMDLAVEIAARKVAAWSGDVRRALQICRIAAEAALNEAEEKGTTLRPVTIQDINRASEDMRNSRHMVAIAQAPDWQRVFLVALFLHLQSSGTDTVPFPSVLRRFQGLCRRLLSDNDVSVEETLALCARLEDIRMVTLHSTASERFPTIRLTIAQDDIPIALRNDNLTRKLLPASTF